MTETKDSTSNLSKRVKIVQTAHKIQGNYRKILYNIIEFSQLVSEII